MRVARRIDGTKQTKYAQYVTHIELYSITTRYIILLFPHALDVFTAPSSESANSYQSHTRHCIISIVAFERPIRMGGEEVQLATRFFQR